MFEKSFKSLEIQIQLQLKKIIDYIIKYINHKLLGLSSNYYKPIDVHTLDDNTNAISLFIQHYLITLLADHIYETISRVNYQSFINNLSVKLYHTLYLHYKRYKINGLGAMLLLRDIKVYENKILNHPQIKANQNCLLKFAQLRILCNVLLPHTVYM